MPSASRSLVMVTAEAAAEQGPLEFCRLATMVLKESHCGGRGA